MNDEMKIEMVEQIARQRFAHYGMGNEDERKAMTNEQKHEVLDFMINLGLQLGLRPDPLWQRKK